MNAAVKLLAASYPMTNHLGSVCRTPDRYAIGIPTTLWLVPVANEATGRSRALNSDVSEQPHAFVWPLGECRSPAASAIGFTSPLIVTCFCRSRSCTRPWAGADRCAVLVGFTGALMIIRPGSGLGNPAVLLLLLSSVAYALYQIATRWVSSYDGAPTGIIFAALFGSLAMSLAMPFYFVGPRTLFDGILFCSLGILGGVGHYLVICAFQLGRAAVIAPFGYVELIGATLLGYLIFNHFPDALTGVGAIVIIASGLYIAWRERYRRAVTVRTVIASAEPSVDAQQPQRDHTEQCHK